MNINRILKLKKINGDFDNLSEKAKFLISMFDDLVVEERTNVIFFYDDNDSTVFYFNTNRKLITCNHIIVFQKIMIRYGFSFENAWFFVNETLKTYLEIPDYTLRGKNGYNKET